MKKKQLHKSNRLVTMLLLVMAILMPYGGHGRKLQVNRQRVTEVKAVLTLSPKLRNWHGSVMR